MIFRIKHVVQYSAWLFLIFCLLIINPSQARQKTAADHYLQIANRIRIEGLQNGKAYQMLTRLTTVAGNRLAGSPGAAAAVELTRQMMLDIGLDQVHLETTTVPRWIRGAEKARIVNSGSFGTVPLTVCAIGGSISTPKMGITAPVIEVKSFDELQQLGEQAKDKIIFFNRAMDPTLMNTFKAYGEAVNQRVQGAIEGAKAGAVAVLVRSLTTLIDDVPHTGMLRYDPQVPKIPAAAISTKGANILSDVLQKEPQVNLCLQLTCRNLSPVSSANVVGQITGTEKPNEIILMGGHLDSWDLSVGAHDDGAGCIHAIEALRLMKALDLKPKRTIRAVMFMNEEFGASGGRDYAVADNRKGEKHLAAIESDRGGFMPVGFGVSGDSSTFEKIQSWFYLFEPLKMHWIRKGGEGADIGPLANEGTVLLGLVPENQRYFDVHHSANDVMKTVHERELELGAIAMAIMSYMLAQEGI